MPSTPSAHRAAEKFYIHQFYINKDSRKPLQEYQAVQVKCKSRTPFVAGQGVTGREGHVFKC